MKIERILNIIFVVLIVGAMFLMQNNLDNKLAQHARMMQQYNTEFNGNVVLFFENGVIVYECTVNDNIGQYIFKNVGYGAAIYDCETKHKGFKPVGK